MTCDDLFRYLLVRFEAFVMRHGNEPWCHYPTLITNLPSVDADSKHPLDRHDSALKKKDQLVTQIDKTVALGGLHLYAPGPRSISG